MAGSKTVISMIGAAAVVAGGWFWLTQQHVLALSLWLLGVAIIVMRKRMRPR